MSIIVGVDEVGRGCWAGPLVAGAVLLRNSIDGLNDSKLLSRMQREHLAEQILVTAEVALGWVEATEIDELGLTKAVRLAMLRALKQLHATYDEIIIDGNFNFLVDNLSASAIIKADMTVPAVSAASIVAKVARDQYMHKMALRYPEYGFQRHVGYGTKLHREMLKVHGACNLHRLSYKPLLELFTNV